MTGDISPGTADRSTLLDHTGTPATRKHTDQELHHALAMAVCDVLWPYPDLALDLSQLLADAGFESLSTSFWVMAQNALAAQPLDQETTL